MCILDINKNLYLNLCKPLEPCLNPVSGGSSGAEPEMWPRSVPGSVTLHVALHDVHYGVVLNLFIYQAR